MRLTEILKHNGFVQVGKGSLYDDSPSNVPVRRHEEWSRAVNGRMVLVKVQWDGDDGEERATLSYGSSRNACANIHTVEDLQSALAFHKVDLQLLSPEPTEKGGAQ